MTRHRIAQIAKKVNPKSPENRHQTRRFLQNRLLHPPPSPPPAQRVGRSSRTTSDGRRDMTAEIIAQVDAEIANIEGMLQVL